MLAKILEDMWVEPEVLAALSEQQKRILFLKMREEQVRRWREREEREQQDGRDVNHATPKKERSKHVSWLLGRDGDVSVSVIGDVDEFRSSKLLRSLFNNRLHSDSMNGIHAGREAERLSFKEDIQPSLTDVTNDLATQNEASSEEDVDSCSTEDDLQDPAEDGDSESGSSLDNLSNWTPLYRPHLSSHGNQPPLKAPLSDTERAGLESRDMFCEEKNPEFGGRVAQLRKAFTSDLHRSSSACADPALPAKPLHLQLR
ncbi:hypothetical protein LDENG_00239790 [Lucifuga dentata]|nr:hypothetical protein LDENG_00239790 [Lucifuga dentata]